MSNRLAPVAREFENILVLRSFEIWAGLAHPPISWAFGSSRAFATAGFEEPAPESAAIAAARATLDDRDWIDATLRLVRDERSRLYRFLRKLSFISPAPSWGPFVAARVEIGARHRIIEALRERGVYVHAPPQPGLEQFIRFGIGSRREMDRLQFALRDLAPRYLG